MKKLLYILGGIIILVIIIAIAGGGGEKEPVEETPESLVEQGQIIVLAPNEVVAEYRDNPIAAKKKYENKLVEISGEVDDIMDFFGEPVVIIKSFELGEKEPWADTLCSFKDEKDVLPLHPGENIIVKGTFDYCMEGASRVYLKDCYIPK